MRGRRNKDKPQGNESLPPCRVCGEPGSGFHYGVTTCGACKGFFRRSLIRKEPYICMQSDLCIVGPSTSRRDSCPKCRHDKCVAVGMSKGACKVGRYSLLKKSKDMKEVMEYRTGSNVSVTNVLQSDEAEQETSHFTSHLESTMKEPFYNNSNNFEILNEFYSPDIAAFSTEKAMRWNLDGRRKESQNDSDNSASCDHDSDDSFNIHEDKRVDDNYDETLSISSCFLGVNCADKLSSEKIDAETLALDTFESRDNVLSEPCYALLKSPAPMNTVPSLVDVDLPKTTYFGYHHNSSMAFSPSSFIQHTGVSPTITPHIHHSRCDTNISFSHSNDGLPHCSQMEGRKLVYDISDNCIRDQQPSPLTSIPSRNENQDSAALHTNSDQNVTQMPDQHNQWYINNLIAQSFNSEDWIKHNEEQSKSNLANSTTNTMDVSVQSSRELPIYYSNESVIQSVGHPCNDVFPHLRRSFEGDLNCNDNSLQMTTTKESRDNHSLNVFSPNNLKKKYEREEDNDDRRKKRCYMKGPHKQSLIKMQPTKGKGDSPASDSGGTSSSNPTFLLYAHPNLSNYALSVFERFPFISYEKETVTSLLNRCYEFGDSLSECMALSQSPSKTNTDNSLISNSSLATAIANSYSQRIPCHTPALTYDEIQMDELFSYLMDTHKHHIKDKLSFMTDSEIQSAHEMFWGLCQFKEVVHGEMKFIEDEKYYTILETTGIDVDKRKEYMFTYMSPMEDSVTRIIQFFRAIPGFNDFTLADKLTLTKSRLPIYYYLSTHRGHDTTKNICIDGESGTATRLGTLHELFPAMDDFRPKVLDLVNGLKSLKLSLEEIVVLKALMLTWPEEDSWLERPDVIEACHKQYCQCLLNLERKRYSSQADDRFFKMVGILYSSINITRQLKVISQQQLTDQVKRLLAEGELPLFKEACLEHAKPKKLTGCEK